MPNLLPLETFRETFGFNPFWFYGLSNATVPITSGCNRGTMKYAWQDENAVGRQDILEAIEVAEHRLEDFLGYSVAPYYRTDRVGWPKYKDIGVWRTTNAVNAAGRFVSVRLPVGHVQSIGTLKRTLLGSPAVQLLDVDKDGLYETFEIRISTTITDPKRLAVYFSALDRMDGEAVSEDWRIAPLKIRFASGQAIIRGRSWLLIQPLLYEGWNARLLDPDDTENYVSTLEIYDTSTETEGSTLTTCQAVLRWESLPHPSFCWCASCSGISYGGSEFDPAAEGLAVARCGIREADIGFVIPGLSVLNSDGTWTAQHLVSFREPESVTVRYQAGFPTEADGQMARKFRTVVARLAAANLDGRQLNCEVANRQLARWQFDLARAAGANDEQYQISPSDLDNPLGTKAGEVYAWKEVANLALL